MVRPDRDVDGGGGDGADASPPSFLPLSAATTGLDFGLGFEFGFDLDLGFGWC